MDKMAPMDVKLKSVEQKPNLIIRNVEFEPAKMNTMQCEKKKILMMKRKNKTILV